MAAAPANGVTPYEVAILVLHYLDTGGYKKTAQSFKREARLILGSAATALPAGVKTLLELLNDYVAVRERDARRQQLQAGNPIALSLYSLLDFHAGLPTPQCLPPAFYAAAPPGPAAAPPAPAGLAEPDFDQHHGGQQQHGAGGGLPGMIPVQAADLTYPAQGQQQGEAEAAGAGPGLGPGQHTPGRHAHRKGAPRKRRKLEESFEMHQQQQQQHAAGGGGYGSYGGGGPDVQHGQQAQQDHVAVELAGGAGGLDPAGLRALDLLNMPLDEEGLMSLLCDDDLQNRFASGLAQHITTALHHHPAGEEGTDDEGGGEGNDQLFAPSIEDVLAELPGDPNMAQLLQQFVRVEGSAGGGGGGGGSGSLSSPPTSVTVTLGGVAVGAASPAALPASRPGSREAQSRGQAEPSQKQPLAGRERQRQQLEGEGLAAGSRGSGPSEGPPGGSGVAVGPDGGQQRVPQQRLGDAVLQERQAVATEPLAARPLQPLPSDLGSQAPASSRTVPVSAAAQHVEPEQPQQQAVAASRGPSPVSPTASGGEAGAAPAVNPKPPGPPLEGAPAVSEAAGRPNSVASGRSSGREPLQPSNGAAEPGAGRVRLDLSNKVQALAETVGALGGLDALDDMLDDIGI